MFYLGKFFGLCNEQKARLDHCFFLEKDAKRKVIAEKAMREERAFEKYLADLETKNKGWRNSITWITESLNKMYICLLAYSWHTVEIIKSLKRISSSVLYCLNVTQRISIHSNIVRNAIIYSTESKAKHWLFSDDRAYSFYYPMYNSAFHTCTQYISI